ncbi:MAG: hypothetical protein GC185_02980 [Alphaproteobacteria bacterium]|nr:hypothetical protein [Alphaproteobacteria bacterium]
MTNPPQDTGQFREGTATGTAMTNAIAAQDLAAIEKLVRGGFPLTDRNGSNNTPLHNALVQGRERSALKLMELGADIHAGGKDGLTPLMLCAMFRRHAVMTALLEKDAQKMLAARTPLGRGALEMAYVAQDGRGQQIMWQYLGHADVQAEFQAAIRHDDLSGARFLATRKDADVEERFEGGVTALETARLFAGEKMQGYIRQLYNDKAASRAARQMKTGTGQPLQPMKKITLRKP